VHISELANHHVENPREVVSQSDPVNVLILEIDGDRRRLSLSLKRVEEGAVPVPRADGGESVHSMPDLKLSEEAFPSGATALEDAEEMTTEAVEDEASEPEAVVEAVVEDVVAEPAADEVVAEATEAEAEADEAAAAPEADADEADETA
jgi:small subunit ribosomal protein S1